MSTRSAPVSSPGAPLTAAGCPPRDSIQRRIVSWSVVTRRVIVAPSYRRRSGVALARPRAPGCGGVDQGDVRERLREVADQPAAADVVLLGEEADVVAQREQSLEELPRLVAAAGQREIVGEPERAGQKRPLARRESVELLGRRVVRVPPHEAVLDELALDRGDRAADA